MLYGSLANFQENRLASYSIKVKPFIQKIHDFDQSFSQSNKFLTQSYRIITGLVGGLWMDRQ